MEAFPKRAYIHICSTHLHPKLILCLTFPQMFWKVEKNEITVFTVWFRLFFGRVFKNQDILKIWWIWRNTPSCILCPLLIFFAKTIPYTRWYSKLDKILIQFFNNHKKFQNKFAKTIDFVCTFTTSLKILFRLWPLNKLFNVKSGSRIFTSRNSPLLADSKNAFFEKPEFWQNIWIRAASGKVQGCKKRKTLISYYFECIFVMDQAKWWKMTNLGQNRIPDKICPGKNFHPEFSFLM